METLNRNLNRNILLYDNKYDQVFREKTDYLNFLFQVYSEIYELKTIMKKFSISKKILPEIQNKKFFFLLLLYNNKGEIFLENSLIQGANLQLLGSSVSNTQTFNESIRYYIENIELQGSKIDIKELEPVTLLEHEFECEGQEIVQRGVAFCARISNELNIKNSNINGQFYPIDEEIIERAIKFTNKEVIEIFKEKFNKINTPFPDQEIDTNKKYATRYAFHNYFVKKFLLTDKLKRKDDFVKKISKILGDSKTLLDVSCGDSKLLLRLKKLNELKFCVANDISWSQVKLLENSSNDKETIFTNHNALYLPFKENIFDVSMCLNTLHHMESRKEMKLLFQNMKKVSKKIIFVEIRDPHEKKGFPSWLNTYYYQLFLGDVGEHFLSEKNFKGVISDSFKEHEIKFSSFTNIQGTYLIAEVTKNDSI